jgi:HK97 family phage major capsid protein
MDIRKEFETLKADALALVEKAKSEGRGLNDEEKSVKASKFSRMNEIRETLDSERELSALALPEAAPIAVSPAVATDAVKAVASASTFSRDNTNMEIKVMDRNEEKRNAVREYARTGQVKNFALTSGTNSGILMPKQVGLSVTKVTTNAIRRGFAALGIAPQIDASYTDNLTMDVFNDSGNLGLTGAEGAAGTSLDANTATSFSLNLVEYHSQAQWLTKKLINNSDFDILASVVPAAQSRNERQEEVDWVALLSAATIGVTSSSAGVFTWEDINLFIDSLGPAYEGLPKFIVMSQGMKSALKNMADANNRPILTPFNGSDVLTQSGVPVVASVNFPAVAAGNVTAALVAVSSMDGAVIRDCTDSEILRYENYPGYPGQIGIEALEWSAFGYNPNAVRTFKVHP